MPNPCALPALNKLAELGIAYTLYEHPPAHTMEDCEGIGGDIGAAHFKNLFLTDRANSVFFLVLLSASKQFRTGPISRQLGASRLSFCTAEQLYDKLKLLPGAVTPLAVLNDAAHEVRVAIDKDIMTHEWLCMHPLVNDATVAIARMDLLRYLQACGCAYQYITAQEAGEG
ncbi:MAG: prolyl-tRNA synthetase associated domain-containing protein [Christensenellaceae bacterium]|jgi:Ala-tRNA(Pro) deacylase|nr:prolyl-tRNA synthetase associated domain-containing protein [Christensenellaceae bacterium]